MYGLSEIKIYIYKKENQFSVFLTVAVLHRVYCSCTLIEWLQVLIILSEIGIWKMFLNFVHYSFSVLK